MELAKITSKGQVTLPINIRRALNLKTGDKVAFVELNGQYVLANPVSLVLREAREGFAGEAERLGLQDEEDVVKLVKEVRKNRD
ncbi:MAG: AbrB/MazE/SpoVT family DNA-binding domain-containing protein [Anaerolineaceae bacterium]|jgi:AbrB family looped-hinge helix DNA binding protein|nr:AbrB/MazE/SpoVT family DNA-binding domain-containing protein [Anaerolineaceae bacterium]